MSTGVPKIGDFVLTRRLPRYHTDGKRVGKVIAIQVGPFLVGGDPAETKYDITIDFGENQTEIWPHWKLKVVSPLEALAIQGTQEEK